MKLLLALSLACLATSTFAKDFLECHQELKSCVKDKKKEKMAAKLEDVKAGLEECRVAGDCINPQCIKDAVRLTLEDDDQCDIDFNRRGSGEKGGFGMLKKLFGGRKGRGFGGKRGGKRGGGRGMGGGNPMEMLMGIKEKMEEKVAKFCKNPEAFRTCAQPKIQALVMEMMMKNGGSPFGGQSPFGGFGGRRDKRQAGRRGGRRGGRGGRGGRRGKKDSEEHEACKAELAGECDFSEKPTREQRQELRAAKKARKEERAERREAKCECLENVDKDALEENLFEECGDDFPVNEEIDNILDKVTDKVCNGRGGDDDDDMDF